MGIYKMGYGDIKFKGDTMPYRTNRLSLHGDVVMLAMIARIGSERATPEE